ncbi:MAG: hypothetical protein Q9227_003925 [Pyrenula ochraceoflavens]
MTSGKCDFCKWRPRSRDHIPNLYLGNEASDLPFRRHKVFSLHVVGRRHHFKDATVGSALVFRRQPENSADENAIAAYDIDGRDLGHLPKEAAAILAPLVDQAAVKLIGRITDDEEYWGYGARMVLYKRAPPATQSALEAQLNLFESWVKGD